LFAFLFAYMSATSLPLQQGSRRYSRLIGSGSYLPGQAITNEALAKRLGAQGVETSDEWIVERTGIRQRYIADEGVQNSDLACAAAQHALAACGLQASSIDLIIVATSTPDVIFPSTACIVQRKLGIAGGAAFDVQAVCSGFAYAVATADAMISLGVASRALVIGSEVFSRIMDWTDRGTCVLFGDGAGAIILEASDAPGVLASRLHADGSHESILRTAGSVAGGKVVGHPFLTMDGQAVFKLAVSVLESVSREVLDVASLTTSDVDWLIPHQANVRILAATGRRLGIDSSKIVVTVDQHANTSAASIPLALDYAWKRGDIKAGQHVLMAGVGGGFTWGAALVRI
jgi:3-oxoacyl-[acyl-carrier-protein] synthase III